MKKLLLLPLLLILASSIYAQSPMFINLNVSKDSVINFLNSKHISRYKEVHDDLIKARNTNTYMNYFFSEGNLCKITLFKDFDEKKDALRAMEETVKFHELTGSIISPLEKLPHSLKRVAVKENIVHEIYFLETSAGYQLQIIRKSFHFGNLNQGEGEPLDADAFNDI